MSAYNQSPGFNRPRLVTKEFLATPQSEGDGAVVRSNMLKFLDPFLMLYDFSVTPPGGFPDHPHREKDGVEARVIAGESMGVKSPVYTRTPIMYLDFTLKPRAQVHQSIPESWSAFVYIIEGEGAFGLLNSQATAHHVLVLGSGDGLSLWNRSSKPLRFILAAGQPINEPVVQHGPFVMNTQAEIEQTIEDYRNCKNGFEMAKYWRSQ
ncbi:hypothetical protein GH714_009517 [Hevea brasiliensis]|uniref:Pirin C-terminal domain-containing protein n=1 Tax=Hevea brasiliensis TaxID=3981 RepID=A0A6A6NAC0_HEVBR|nr:hypothetical protein GH714_009517 [Hevea brasiliensis]